MMYSVQKERCGRAAKAIRTAQVFKIVQRFGRRPLPDIGDFLAVMARTRMAVPLVGSTVAAGFPSPADDYLDRSLDFNELLIANPAATFAVRVTGDSMIGVGIFPGDIAVVDRSHSPADRSIILALVDGEFTLKRYRRRSGKIWLESENAAYKDIPITEDMTFEVWGVIQKSIRIL